MSAPTVVALNPEARGVETHAKHPSLEITLCLHFPSRREHRLYIVPHQQVTCRWCQDRLAKA